MEGSEQERSLDFLAIFESVHMPKFNYFWTLSKMAKKSRDRSSSEPSNYHFHLKFAYQKVQLLDSVVRCTFDSPWNSRENNNFCITKKYPCKITSQKFRSGEFQKQQSFEMNSKVRWKVGLFSEEEKFVLSNEINLCS